MITRKSFVGAAVPTEERGAAGRTLGGRPGAVKHGGIGMEASMERREPGPETRIAIVGAGALGTLLAACFSRAGLRVRVLARSVERATALRREAPAAEHTDDPAGLVPASLLFLCVKSYQTSDAAAEIAPFTNRRRASPPSPRGPQTRKNLPPPPRGSSRRRASARRQLRTLARFSGGSSC